MKHDLKNANAALGQPPARRRRRESHKRKADRRRTPRSWRSSLLILLALGAARTVISRMSNSRALEEGTAERAKHYVKVAAPKPGDAGQTLSLPGTLQGFVQSPIAARASGYLKSWYKDIGSRVEKGELLAEIETPEIDQQLSQAIAARQQAAASLDLAREHGRALGEPAQEGRGLAAGTGRAAQRQHPGRRQSRRGRRQRRAAAPARRLQAHRRALRRRDHATQRRRRRPDRRRQQRRPRRCSSSRRPIRCASTSTCRRRIRRSSSPGRRSSSRRRSCAAARSRARSRARRRRSTRRRARCRSRWRCPTATERCCPARSCRSRCRSRRALRSRFRPMRC